MTLIYHNMVKAAIWQSKAFGPLTPEQVDLICDAMEIQCYEDGETVYKKEDLEGTEIVVVLEGRLVKVSFFSLKPLCVLIRPYVQ